MLLNHKKYDYEGFFLFMDAFLDDQINLKNSYSVNRDKLIKKMRVMKHLNKRILDDNYFYGLFDYTPNEDDFLKITSKKNLVMPNTKAWQYQRKSDLDLYTKMINKYILDMWD